MWYRKTNLKKWNKFFYEFTKLNVFCFIYVLLVNWARRRIEGKLFLSSIDSNCSSERSIYQQTLEVRREKIINSIHLQAPTNRLTKRFRFHLTRLSVNIHVSIPSASLIRSSAFVSIIGIIRFVNRNHMRRQLISLECRRADATPRQNHTACDRNRFRHLETCSCDGEKRKEKWFHQFGTSGRSNRRIDPSWPMRPLWNSS